MFLSRECAIRRFLAGIHHSTLAAAPLRLPCRLMGDTPHVRQTRESHADRRARVPRARARRAPAARHADVPRGQSATALTGAMDPGSRPESAIGLPRRRPPQPGVPEANRLLGALSPRAYAELLRQGELVTLAHGHVVYEPASPTTEVYFPQTAVFSMVREMTDGAGVEVGTIGRDGVVGASVLSGATSMSTRCIVQIPGRAYRIPAACPARRSGSLARRRRGSGWRRRTRAICCSDTRRRCSSRSARPPHATGCTRWSNGARAGC